MVIAEAGCNHNGNLKTAFKLIEMAALSGADAIKFQTFKAERLVTSNASKAPYQGEGSQFEMLKSLELEDGDYAKLKSCCRFTGIKFISAPYDLESIDILNSIGLDIFKIPSSQITDIPYLRKIGSLKKNVILSTGMSTMLEVANAVYELVESGTQMQSISILHCNSEYPTPICDINLKAIETIKKAFPDCPVGYSDHTEGIEIPIAAVALGANIIEKHFTIDRNMIGPDHKSSLGPREFAKMVKGISDVEIALGNGVKEPSESELKNKPFMRKSIVALVSIKEGEVFTEFNLTTKRPGIGISPTMWDDVVGTKAQRSYQKDDLI